MGEAYEDGGHEMLNHLGLRIRVTERTLEALEMRGYLHRNRETGLKKMSLNNYLIFVEAERSTDHFYELGEDCSGPNQVVCDCQKCRERTNLDDSRISDLQTTLIVGEVTARRKKAA
jgi:hypothetical protein